MMIKSFNRLQGWKQQPISKLSSLETVIIYILREMIVYFIFSRYKDLTMESGFMNVIWLLSSRDMISFHAAQKELLGIVIFAR
jgi:hypothetical protein